MVQLRAVSYTHLDVYKRQGAQWATIASTAEAHPYDFAIIESAATSLDDFWIKFPLPYNTLQLMNFLFPKYKKKIRPIDRVRDIKRLKSMLLIYSEIDDWTPVSYTHLRYC